MSTDDAAPLAWTPPPGWVDPRDDDSLPWIQHPQPDDLDPVPPEERLAEEPEEVEAARNGQAAAPELGAGPAGSQVLGLIAPAIHGINLRDYSRNPQARGFGSPCAQNMAVIQLAEARISVHVALAELAGLIMRAAEARGYRYRKADTGCFNCRKIGGGSSWSWHAWAVAIDANWQSNPMRRPLTTDRPRWELDLWNRYGWAWGGDYTGSTPPDTMHTEFMGTSKDAAAATELARRELGGAPKPAPAPAPAPGPPPPHPSLGLPDLVKGRASAATKRWQDWWNAYPFRPALLPIIRPTSTMFGPQTEAAVKKTQQRYGLAADGIVGPMTKRLFWDLGWRG